MSISGSILYPTGPRQTDRKYYEAGVRGRFEGNLRIERGRIDTTGPTIREGAGFTLVKNGTGDVTITFDPPFSAIPTVVGVVDNSIGTAAYIITHASSPPPTASAVRLLRLDLTAVLIDGGMDFIAMGPS